MPMAMLTPSAASELPSWARWLLIGVFVAGVIPVAVYGIYRSVVTNRQTGPQIEQQLLEPYRKAIAARQFDEAYQQFTTAGFRERVRIEEFRKGHADNRAEYGWPRELRLHTCNETKEPGREWYIICNVEYQGTKKQVNLSYDVVQQGERYLLDRSYRRNTASNSRAEQVF